MAEKIADGIYPNFPRADYDAVERVNISTLHLIERSPLHYQDALNARAEDEADDSEAMLVGRVTHTLTLEPHTFMDAVAVWDGQRRGNDYKAFCALNEGKEIISEKQRQLCESMASAVRESEQARPYLDGGQSEVAMLWTRTAGGGVYRQKIECKGRVDKILPGVVIADLKSTRDARPAKFGIQAAELFHYAKAAWYSDALEQITGERLEYVLIAVENRRPFAVQVYHVTPPQLQKGRELYGQWLDRLAFCRSTYPAGKRWPAYRESATDLELPKWAPPVDAAEVVEIVEP